MPWLQGQISFIRNAAIVAAVTVLATLPTVNAQNGTPTAAVANELSGVDVVATNETGGSGEQLPSRPPDSGNMPAVHCGAAPATLCTHSAFVSAARPVHPSETIN